MENKVNFRILECIGEVYEKAENCQLKEELFIENEAVLSKLSGYFGVSKTQSFFMALVFALNYDGDRVSFNDLVKYFDCNPMKILEYNEDFKVLEKKEFFNKKPTLRGGVWIRGKDRFELHEEISEAILEQKPIPDLELEMTDIFELLSEVYVLTIRSGDKDLTIPQLIVKVEQLLEKHSHFQLIQKIQSFKLSAEDKILYLNSIWFTLQGRESFNLESALSGIINKATPRVRYMQDVLNGNNALVQHELLEILPADFINAIKVKLTRSSGDLLKACNISVFFKSKAKSDNMIRPEDIATRTLIFSPTEMKPLYLLKDVLQSEQFKATQKRLEEKNLPQGIAALLHGAPGTGKTEVVKQIAKETSRELMKVDISQSKSMWFGESEKIVKKIFTDYKNFREDSELTPILFLNEADALISKRGDIGSSNTRQTENAIQNILLEELENFEGVLIATTNLVHNLDPAFERRFLFKIRFTPPSAAVRAEIWKLKLPSLSLEDCHVLAERFNFSGGQIDNIFRKSEINEIIYGEKVALENLLVFCAEETLTHQRNEIGFGKL